jgi:hypothetical protein
MIHHLIGTAIKTGLSLHGPERGDRWQAPDVDAVKESDEVAAKLEALIWEGLANRADAGFEGGGCVMARLLPGEEPLTTMPISIETCAVSRPRPKGRATQFWFGRAHVDRFLCLSVGGCPNAPPDGNIACNGCVC